MTIDSPIVNAGIPLAICLLSSLPLILMGKFGIRDNEVRSNANNLIACYLLVLGLAIFALIVIEGIEVMGINNGARALFLCSVLLVACLDRLINLSTIRKVIKTTLANTLFYFVTLLCSIPIIWQLLLYLVPQSISNQLKMMSAIEILLMLIMLVLGMISRPTKKIETTSQGE